MSNIKTGFMRSRWAGSLSLVLGVGMAGLASVTWATEGGNGNFAPVAGGWQGQPQQTAPGTVPPPPGPFQSGPAAGGGFAPTLQPGTAPSRGDASVPAGAGQPGMMAPAFPSGGAPAGAPSPAAAPHMGQGGITREEFLRQQAEFRKRMEAEMEQRRKELEQQHEAIRRQHEQMMSRPWQPPAPGAATQHPEAARQAPAAPDFEALRKESEERFRKQQEEFEAQRKAMEERRRQIERNLPQPPDVRFGQAPGEAASGTQPQVQPYAQPQTGGWTQPPAYGYGAPAYAPYPYAPGAWAPPVPPTPWVYPPAGYAAPYGSHAYPGTQAPSGSSGNR